MYVRRILAEIYGISPEDDPQKDVFESLTTERIIFPLYRQLTVLEKPDHSTRFFVGGQLISREEFFILCAQAKPPRVRDEHPALWVRISGVIEAIGLGHLNQSELSSDFLAVANIQMPYELQWDFRVMCDEIDALTPHEVASTTIGGGAVVHPFPPQQRTRPRLVKR